MAEAIAERLSRNLCQRAAGYFPEYSGKSVSARLLTVRERVFSDLYQFELSCAGQRRILRVKVTRCGVVGTSSLVLPPEMSRISLSGPIPIPSPEPPGREHRALSRIEAHFARLKDSRFCVVRILDCLSHENAFVMDEFDGTSLSRLLQGTHRFAAADRVIEVSHIMRNSGAWLREFHKLRPEGLCDARIVTQDDFVEQIGMLRRHFAGAWPGNSWMRKVAERTIHFARRLLPAELPAAIVHGDYAPRNVLVGSSKRVAGFDTLADRWSPVSEDIGHFLYSLKFNKAQACSAGLAFRWRVLAEYEGQFLRGYFDAEVIPLAVIRLFEVQSGMTKWAAMNHAARSQRSWRKVSRSPARLYLAAWHARCLRRLLDDIEALCSKDIG